MMANDFSRMDRAALESTLTRHQQNRVDLEAARTAFIERWQADDAAAATAREKAKEIGLERFDQGLRDIDAVIAAIVDYMQALGLPT
jgi:hypothetical protein